MAGCFSIEVLSTLVESIEIVETIPALIDGDVVISLELSRRALSGPVDLFREDARSNQARNATFELTMGAMAASGSLLQFSAQGIPMSVSSLRIEGYERNARGLFQRTKSSSALKKE